MAELRPFRALRPKPQYAEEVASVPYDVIDVAEARRLAEGRPHSFLRIIRPELGLNSDMDEYDEAVYEQGAANLKAYAESDISVRDEVPSLYLYQMQTSEHTQTGVFGCVSVDEYNRGLILQHEKTRPAKEKDRMRHMIAQRAHAEPVMLCFRDNVEITKIIERETDREPLYDLVTSNDVRHRIWKVTQGRSIVRAFEQISPLYIADGHHRCKAASLATEVLCGEADKANECRYFPAALFPMDQMRILPYHRLVKSLGMPVSEFIERCSTHATELEKVSRAEGEAGPKVKGEVVMYVGDRWYRLSLPSTRRDTVADSLDVARLSEFILEPVLEIEDLRRDDRIGFVGGRETAGDLARRVDEQGVAVAFAMYPTSIEELLEVSDAGLLMPPKSTWFEPKVSSGLLVHQFA